MLKKCLHPLLAEREQNLIKDKLQAAMKKNGIEYMIINHKDNIFYSTGYMPIGVGNVVSIVPANGNPALVLSTLESMDARCTTNDVEIYQYLSWVFIDDGTPECLCDKGDLIDPNATIHLIKDIIKPNKITGKVGIEMGSISLNLYQRLTSIIPKEIIIDCTSTIMDARVVKTPWEIKMLKIGAEHLERTWHHMALDIKAGMPAYKLDNMFMAYASQCNDYDSITMKDFHWIPAVGPYYGQSGLPRNYILKDGDIVRFDVGFRHMCYTTDIARTFVVGDTASDLAQEVYDILYRANVVGQQYLKPGVKCSDLYNAVRAEVEKSKLIPKYPRGHVGHSVGLSTIVEEWPTLSPFSHTVMEPGMVFSLETPYSATGAAQIHAGFNIEDTFVITEDGHERFTIAPDSLFWK